MICFGENSLFCGKKFVHTKVNRAYSLCHCAMHWILSWEKEGHSTEGIALQGCIVIWLGRWNTHMCSVHSNEMRHLRKGKSLGNGKCYEFSGWGNWWVKKSNLFQLSYWKPIYSDVLDASLTSSLRKSKWVLSRKI